MAKRDAEIEPPEDELVEPDAPTAGQRLRAAREQKKLSLEDVAAQTRIPQRHLASIENAEWDSLPAPTYTIGFAKSYASAVDLDRTDIGTQLREEMGGQRFANTSSDVFEPADPARTMPKSLVIGAIIAVILLVGIMSWLNKRSLEEPGTANPPPVTRDHGPCDARGRASCCSRCCAGAGSHRGHSAGMDAGARENRSQPFRGLLQPGQNYTVPATAASPVLKTGKPEALRISVGDRVVGPVGPAATTVSNVSLLPADLLKMGQAAPAAAPPAIVRLPPRAGRKAKQASSAAARSCAAIGPGAGTRDGVADQHRPIGFIAAQAAAVHIDDRNRSVGKTK